MSPRSPVQAAQTELIRILETEWQVLSRSRWLRERLQVWAADDARPEFDDGEQPLGATQNRNASSSAERDQVLIALLERCLNDPLARRVGLQVVLTRVKSLIAGLRGWDVEERASREVATAMDVRSGAHPSRRGHHPTSGSMRTHGAEFCVRRFGTVRNRWCSSTTTATSIWAKARPEVDPRWIGSKNSSSACDATVGFPRMSPVSW